VVLGLGVGVLGCWGVGVLGCWGGKSCRGGWEGQAVWMVGGWEGERLEGEALEVCNLWHGVGRG